MDKWWTELSPDSKPSVSAAVCLLQVAGELRQRPSIGYATAFATVGLATAVQWLGQDFYAGAPFLTIYPAVIVTTLIGGLGAGLVSAILAGASQWGLFIPNFHWLAMVSYVFDATVCVLLIVFINVALDRLLIDVDQEKQAKHHQYLLAKELHHRIQNFLTVIQAVIRFSIPNDGTIQASMIKRQLMDRIQSMSAANRTITDSMGDGIRLIDLINGEISAFKSRFEINGNTAIALGPQMTQNLSLILHELLTNALKHGALSVPRGRVSLRLDLTHSVLTFAWQERDGPRVAPPLSSGFGSRILDTFARGFCQNVDICYAESGLRYTLQISSDRIKSLPRLMTTARTSESAVTANAA